MSRLSCGMIAEWVRNALKFAGLNQSEAARRLTESVGHEINRSAMSQIVKGGRALRADEMLALSRITGYALPETAPQPAVSGLTRAAIESALSEAVGDAGLGRALARATASALANPQHLAGSAPEDVMRLTVRTLIREKLREARREPRESSQPH